MKLAKQTIRAESARIINGWFHPKWVCLWTIDIAADPQRMVGMIEIEKSSHHGTAHRDLRVQSMWYVELPCWARLPKETSMFGFGNWAPGSLPWWLNGGVWVQPGQLLIDQWAASFCSPYTSTPLPTIWLAQRIFLIPDIQPRRCPRAPGVTSVTGAGRAHWWVISSGHFPHPAG